MKLMYTGPNKLREAFNRIAATVLTLYAVGGSSVYVSTKTGHPSADIATGRSQPTALEQIIMGLADKGDKK
jgi:hypothetical protein